MLELDPSQNVRLAEQLGKDEENSRNIIIKLNIENNLVITKFSFTGIYQNMKKWGQISKGGTMWDLQNHVDWKGSLSIENVFEQNK